MANEREVFTVLETSTGAGQSWRSKQEGAAIATVEHAPAIVAKKQSQYVLLPVETEGVAIGDAVPVLGAKDSSGNLAYIPLNSDGAVIVSPDEEGTIIEDEATVSASVGSDTDVVTLTLTASEDYKKIDVVASCTFLTLWKILQVDDVTETDLVKFITGPGSFSFEKLFEHLEFTAGATGSQELKLIGKQIYGPASDLNGYIGVLEKA